MGVDDRTTQTGLLAEFQAADQPDTSQTGLLAEFKAVNQPDVSEYSIMAEFMAVDQPDASQYGLLIEFVPAVFVERGLIGQSQREQPDLIGHLYPFPKIE